MARLDRAFSSSVPNRNSYVPKGDLILSKVAKAVYLDKLEEEEEEEEERFELYEY